MRRLTGWVPVFEIQIFGIREQTGAILVRHRENANDLAPTSEPQRTGNPWHRLRPDDRRNFARFLKGQRGAGTGVKDRAGRFRTRRQKEIARNAEKCEKS